MKLATRTDGTRDGQLLVVSRDLATAHLADAIAPTLQRALDDWAFIAPQLEDLYSTLNLGKARHAFPFDPRQCAAPLPRACQWIDAGAYPTHFQRVEGARGEYGCGEDGHGEGGRDDSGHPEGGRAPRLRQGASDDFIAPTGEARFASEDWGIDFEAGVAAILDDVPAGSAPVACAARIRLLALSGSWVLRELPGPGARALAAVQARPWTTFAAVAATPDELGDAWRDTRPHRPVLVHRNGRRAGEVDAGAGLAWGFGELAALAARTRNLRSGTVLGAGVASAPDASTGCACVAEARALEAAQGTAARTPWLRYGERVRAEMTGSDGQSVFGAIDQEVSPVRA